MFRHNSSVVLEGVEWKQQACKREGEGIEGGKRFGWGDQAEQSFWGWSAIDLPLNFSLSEVILCDVGMEIRAEITEKNTLFKSWRGGVHAQVIWLLVPNLLKLEILGSPYWVLPGHVYLCLTAAKLLTALRTDALCFCWAHRFIGTAVSGEGEKVYNTGHSWLKMHGCLLTKQVYLRWNRAEISGAKKAPCSLYMT